MDPSTSRLGAMATPHSISATATTRPASGDQEQHDHAVHHPDSDPRQRMTGRVGEPGANE